MTRKLTPDEAKAIAALRRLAKTWPQTLSLFSWSGSLIVMDATMTPGAAAELEAIHGILNDGGDPS